MVYLDVFFSIYEFYDKQLKGFIEKERRNTSTRSMLKSYYSY